VVKLRPLVIALDDEPAPVRVLLGELLANGRGATQLYGMPIFLNVMQAGYDFYGSD
jgi:hypothetical protein